MALLLAACHTPTREARRMLHCAERLLDTLPDSTLSIIDSVMRMETYLSDDERMEMALLQGEALFGSLDAEGIDLLTSEGDTMDRMVMVPELKRAADFFADKKQYGKAAHAALYNGYANNVHHDKTAAMQAFKEAEHYGKLADDTLTMVWAEYQIGRLWFKQGMDEEAIRILEATLQGFDKDSAAIALVQNMIAICYLLQHDYEKSELFFQQGLSNAKKAHSHGILIKLLNNYATLYRLKGEYDHSIHCLKTISDGRDLDDATLLMNYLNLGMTYSAMGEMDSALSHFQLVESLIDSANIKKETHVAAHLALSRFAEANGDLSSALRHRKQYDKCLDEVWQDYEQNSIYLIQRKYDYDAVKNDMNKKIIQSQGVITILTIIAALVLAAFAVAKIRLADIRKNEAEAKAELMRFMRQYENLAIQNEEHNKMRLDLEQKYKEAVEAAGRKERHIMQKLAVYLGNKGDASSLQALSYSVWGGQGFWEATWSLFDRQFPQLRQKLKSPPFELTEKEAKTLILLYLDASREDTASLLGTSVAMVDKMRNNARKKMARNAESPEQQQK